MAVFEQLRVYSTVSEEPNISDRVLAKTFLKLIPQSVTPNQVTIFRYITIPIILYLLFFSNHLIGVILFLISAFSDAIDGALARTRNKITDWGKIHDPLADKLLIGTVGALVVSIYINFYLIATIILIEISIIIKAIFKIRRGDKTITALLPGKIKMILQSVGVSLVLIYIVLPWAWLLPVATVLLYLSIFFALISLIVYSSI